MRFSILFWGGLLVLISADPFPAWGQDRGGPDTLQVLDLSTLLAELEANNASLRAARLEADALGTRSRQVKSLPDPTFMVTALPWSIGTARGAQRSQWRVEQQIPYPGKRALRSEIAALSADVAASEADTYALDLTLHVKQAYYDLYRVQEVDRLIVHFQEHLRDFEEAAATRYEVGTGTQQAILKAQIEHNRLDVRREQLAEQERSLREQLARLLERPDRALLAGEVRVDTPVVMPDTTRLLDVALSRRPEVQALRQADARADRQIDLAERAFRPDFSVSLAYFDIADADVPPTADGRDALAVGVGVKVPLWRRKLQAGLEEAEVKKRQVAARVEALETSFRTQLDDLTNQFVRRRRRLDQYEQVLIPQAEIMLEATLSAYNTGRTGFIDLLDAERTLFGLRLDAVETASAYWQTVAALERALGVTSLNDV